MKPLDFTLGVPEVAPVILKHKKHFYTISDEGYRPTQKVSAPWFAASVARLRSSKGVFKHCFLFLFGRMNLWGRQKFRKKAGTSCCNLISFSEFCRYYISIFRTLTSWDLAVFTKKSSWAFPYLRNISVELIGVFPIIVVPLFLETPIYLFQISSDSFAATPSQFVKAMPSLSHLRKLNAV